MINLNIIAIVLGTKVSRETPDSDNDATCAELRNDEKFMSSVVVDNNGSSSSRPVSIVSEVAAAPTVGPENEEHWPGWMNIVKGKCVTGR